MGFILHHRSKDQSGLPLTGVAVWATCLREIAFLDDHGTPSAVKSVKGADQFENGEAMFFLLQVLCGLRSPVLGETEVLGQFKAHLRTVGEDHPLKRDPTLLPFLLNTVKEARTKFLSATGSLTYGQIVRRWLKEFDSVALWGYGSLGKEIYPWIREKTQAVVVRTERDGAEGVPFTLKDANAKAHVVAAPLGDDAVAELARGAFVIDLRDRPLAGTPTLKNLGDLFREIRDLRREREDVVPRCEEYLRQRVEEYLQRHQIRPFGWEDLCG